ncbi:hypothetical protein [Hyphomicrobium sp. ghe19]|uniref:hypothetical protein n=1 Tax=Hyphomicrobium sp. ghe19 TaxID=2682968 RepID=UPI00136769D3|nr:hypothetical protein HYPP_01961 [Hyphomicrobium sp. ghe19]
MTQALIIPGTDNSGKPRQDFANQIAALDDAAFVKEAEHRIWLSAYANNNPRSDYHWQADACYDEAQRREKPELYIRAFNNVSAGAQ